MSAEQNKTIVRRYVEAVNQQDYDTLDAIVAPELLTATKQLVASIYATFAGHRADITNMVAEGDQVWVQLATSGGHTGEFAGIPPTGKQWTNRGVYFFQLRNGKIIVADGLFDDLNLMKQVGATITPPHPQ